MNYFSAQCTATLSNTGWGGIRWGVDGIPGIDICPVKILLVEARALWAEHTKIFRGGSTQKDVGRLPGRGIQAFRKNIEKYRQVDDNEPRSSLAFESACSSSAFFKRCARNCISAAEKRPRCQGDASNAGRSARGGTLRVCRGPCRIPFIPTMDPILQDPPRMGYAPQQKTAVRAQSLGVGTGWVGGMHDEAQGMGIGGDTGW